MLFNQNQVEELISTKERLNRNKARALATCIYNTQETTKGMLKKAQEKKEQDVNKYYRPVDFSVKGYVYVFPKNQKSDRLSQKLGHQIEGLYKVLK